MQATNSLSPHFTRLLFCSDRGIELLVYAQWCRKCQLRVLLGLQRWACASMLMFAVPMLKHTQRPNLLLVQMESIREETTIMGCNI
jgi:hypothetical protein